MGKQEGPAFLEQDLGPGTRDQGPKISLMMILGRTLREIDTVRVIGVRHHMHTFFLEPPRKADESSISFFSGTHQKKRRRNLLASFPPD